MRADSDETGLGRADLPRARRSTGGAHPHRHAVIRPAEPLPCIIPPERPVVIAERVAATDLAGVFATSA